MTAEGPTDVKMSESSSHPLRQQRDEVDETFDAGVTDGITHAISALRGLQDTGYCDDLNSDQTLDAAVDTLQEMQRRGVTHV